MQRNRTIAFVGWMQRGEREPRSREAAPRPAGAAPAPRRRRAQLPPARLGGPCRGPPCDAQPRSPEAQQATARPAFAICLVDLSAFRHFGFFFHPLVFFMHGDLHAACLPQPRPSRRCSRSPGQPGAARRSTTGTAGVAACYLCRGVRYARKSSSSPPELRNSVVSIPGQTRRRQR